MTDGVRERGCLLPAYEQAAKFALWASTEVHAQSYSRIGDSEKTDIPKNALNSFV